MANVWAPYKELVGVVSAAILRSDPEAYHSLDVQLKKHKPDFICLLKNPTKNASWRAKLQRANEGVLDFSSLPSSLPLDLVAEALELSDLLDLNEVSAVELLLAGEQQLPRFPTYTRRLLAFLLYHDGRRSIVAALRQLIQAREGVSWTSQLPPPTSHLVNIFTDQLFKDGLLDRILSLLDSICVDDELGRLATLNVGNMRTESVLAKHQQEISEFVREQRTGLAECLLYWACQTPFGKEDTLKVIKFLQKVPVVTMLSAAASTDASAAGVSVGCGDRAVLRTEGAAGYGVMDPVSLCLFHTLLACFNLGDHTAENAVDESLIDDYRPIIYDTTYTQDVHAYLASDTPWVTPELRGAVLFAWGVLLRECACRVVFSGRMELEDDDNFVEQGIRSRALLFLRRSVIAAPQFHQEEAYVRRMHWLITSFIVNMHLRIKELRNRGDEVAKGISRRGGDMKMGNGFEELMLLIGDLYASDPHNLQLSREFWPVPASSPSRHSSSSLHTRAPHRQISLCKFLSTCSDFLPAPLFSPLMHMLTGLSSSPLTAHHAFSLLEANSPTLGGGGASAAISLEHFFSSLRQYYHGLRGGGVSRNPPTSGCGISPQEVQGLMDVLTIIGTIAKHDENARVIMYENQAWLPVATLFGLIGCPIPQELKAKIFQTLAMFALSPEIASSMWHTLEIAQVLNTQQSRHGHLLGAGGMGMAGGAAAYRHHIIPEGSIEVELRELECRREEYPLTRSFLELLLVLVEVPVPPTLGMGHRVPGFLPYIQFVRDTIFLEFDTRAYRDPNEKWEVGRLALDIMHKLLVSHEISAEDFTEHQYKLPQGGVAIVPQPPGYILLEHMLHDSPLLKKVLAILHKALQVLLAQDHTPPATPIVCTALLCLKLLGASLERETDFHDHLRRAAEPKKDLTPLYRLLSEVNPCSNKPDHMINIAQYVCLTRCPPELALEAVRVLCGLCQTPKAGLDLAASLAGNKEVCGVVVHGFVEHLEWEEEMESPDPQQDKDSLYTSVGLHRAIRVQILKLLSATIDRHAPNIAHLLLGFGMSESAAAEATLQDPGVRGSARTCLHSILMLVEHSQNQTTPTLSVHHAHPQLAELCYKLLYQLCAHSSLSTPTLRYLRNNHDFVHKQISHLPLDQIPRSRANDNVPDSTHCIPSHSHLSVLHQQAWLLKLAAIELRMALLSQQRSHTQRLLNLLLSESNGNGHTPNALGLMQGYMAGPDVVGSEVSLMQEGRRKLLVLLDLVKLDDHVRPALELDYFDSKAVEAVLRQCEAKDEVSGALYCDVKELYKLLMRELYSTQGAPLARHQHSILEEIHKLLAVVVERNQVQATSHAAAEMFEAWHQVMEVTLHAMLQDGVKREMKLAVIFEVIQDLLLKVSQCESSALTTSVHGIVLILLSHLRLAALAHVSSSGQEDTLLPSLYSGPLLVIMRGLMEQMLQAPANMQQLRVYLLGSLLYYLSLTQQPDTLVDMGPRGLWDADRKEDSLAEANLSTLRSFGEPFMDAVCKNACSGHDVARMLSLSLLDAVVRSDWHCVWLKFLCQHGYLHTLCASLQWEDDGLKKMLHPIPEALRALYIYESKMAFLTRVADRPVGARELTSINAVNYLSQCCFIDLRPSHHINSYYGDYHTQSSRGFIPSILERYRQLLFPLLKFLFALLTCPGPHHKEVVGQVTSLIGAHCDVFAAVLKEEFSGLTISTLQELALVTGLIAQSGVGHDWSKESSSLKVSGLVHLQRLMLTHLPHFWSTHCCKKIVKQAVEGEESNNETTPSDEASLLVQQISSNIVTYCRVAMTMGGVEFSVPHCRILLKPDLSEAMSAPPPSQDPFSSLVVTPVTSQPPSLGLLIQHLQECVESYVIAHDSFQQLHQKKEKSGPLSSDDIRQLLSVSISTDKLPVTQQQVLARRRLSTLVSHKKKELLHYAYVVENLLYLLWQHLQFYLLRSKPADPHLQFGKLTSTHTAMRRVQDYSSSKTDNKSFDLTTLGERISSSDLEQLRTNLPKCLTDALFKKLLDLEEIQLQEKSEKKIGFVHALVRRIKRLLKLKTY